MFPDHITSSFLLVLEPSGMVACWSDSALDNCSAVTMAFSRLAKLRSV